MVKPISTSTRGNAPMVNNPQYQSQRSGEGGARSSQHLMIDSPVVIQDGHILHSEALAILFLYFILSWPSAFMTRR
jgi:hypothetical protein